MGCFDSTINPTREIEARGLDSGWVEPSFGPRYAGNRYLRFGGLDGIPSLKLTASLPLKLDGCNTSFLLGFGLFSGGEPLVSGMVNLEDQSYLPFPRCWCLPFGATERQCPIPYRPYRNLIVIFSGVGDWIPGDSAFRGLMVWVA